MRNTIYFTMVLFVGVASYFISSAQFDLGNYTLASIVFLLSSFIIYIMVSSYKNKGNITSLQILTYITSLSIYVIYGLMLTISLIQDINSDLESNKIDASLIVVGLCLLLYSIGQFIEKFIKE